MSLLSFPQGCVAEQGTHMELLRQGGLYSRLVSKQLLAFENPVAFNSSDPKDEVRGAAGASCDGDIRDSRRGNCNISNGNQENQSNYGDIVKNVLPAAMSNSIAASYGSIRSFHSVESNTDRQGQSDSGSPCSASLRTPLSASPNVGFESS